MVSPERIASARRDLERERGRRSLSWFARAGWGVIEPNPLRWSWHMGAVCAHLEAVSRGEILDLVICVPPGTSKSLLASSFWPAWDWIDHPERRFLCSTYAQDLTEKNAKHHRNLVRSEWYRARWDTRISDADTDKVREFGTPALGWRISTSVGGISTGRHADVILGDDLVKAQDAEGRNYVDPVAIQKANEFWFGAMQTRRVDAATTRRVMIAQRLHHEDTPGKCIEAGYTALVLPMVATDAPCTTRVFVNGAPFKDPRAPGELLCPDRFPAEVVEQDRQRLGPLTFEAQNQQNPTPRQGLIFRSAGDNRWSSLPDRWGRLVMTVDCSFKNRETSDFVAIQVWGRAGPHFYLLDRVNRRLGVSGTIQAILEVRDRWPLAGIYVEDKANGPAVVEILKGEIPGVHEWSPGTNSKESRAEAVAHLFDSGNVWLPPDSEAPWIGEYLGWLKKFPLARHDDDVDATTMALLILYAPKTARYVDMVRKIASGRA